MSASPDTTPERDDDLLDDPIALLRRRGPVGRLLSRALSADRRRSTDPIQRALRLRRRVAYGAAALFVFYAWYVTNYTPSVEIAPTTTLPAPATTTLAP